MMNITYISKHANAYGRLILRPKVKHVRADGTNQTLCGLKLRDTFTVSTSSKHRVCERCERISTEIKR